MPWLLAIVLLVSGCGPESEDPGKAPATTPAPPPEPPPAPTPAPTRLGFWVLAEGSHRALEDPRRIDALVEAATGLGVTDLFIQVYRGGRSWFPSDRADETPYRQIQSKHGVDPLARLLVAAHAQGIRVHAWFNALSLATNREAPILRHLGPGAVLVDRKGRSLLDYPDLEVPDSDGEYLRMGTPGVWLDPSVPGLIEYLEETLDDLLAAAPELDGLHLDFIRHPMALPLLPGSRFDVGLDFGYGPESRRRFEEETGEPFRRGQAWDDFRRERVSEVVRRLCTRLPARSTCSAAVIPFAERAYLTAMQDYGRWLEEGWLDLAVAMTYTRDDRLLRYTAHALRGGVGGDRIWLGLGAWLFLEEPQRLRAQMDVAREARAPGLCLFSYDALTEAPDLLRDLSEVRPLESRDLPEGT